MDVFKFILQEFIETIGFTSQENDYLVRMIQKNEEEKAIRVYLEEKIASTTTLDDMLSTFYIFSLASYQSKTLMHLLKRAGIDDINALDPGELWEGACSALHYAVFEKNLSKIAFLLELGIDANLPREEDGNTALHYAASLGSIEMVQLFLQKGRHDFFLKNKQGRTALGSAIENTHFSCSKLIYESFKKEFHDSNSLLLLKESLSVVIHSDDTPDLKSEEQRKQLWQWLEKENLLNEEHTEKRIIEAIAHNHQDVLKRFKPIIQAKDPTNYYFLGEEYTTLLYYAAGCGCTTVLNYWLEKTETKKKINAFVIDSKNDSLLKEAAAEGNYIFTERLIQSVYEKAITDLEKRKKHYTAALHKVIESYERLIKPLRKWEGQKEKKLVMTMALLVVAITSLEKCAISEIQLLKQVTTAALLKQITQIAEEIMEIQQHFSKNKQSSTALSLCLDANIKEVWYCLWEAMSTTSIGKLSNEIILEILSLTIQEDIQEKTAPFTFFYHPRDTVCTGQVQELLNIMHTQKRKI